MVVKRQHYNKPQLKSMIIGSPNETVIAGRATGKTVGILAPKTTQCYFGTMPRSTGVILSATYTQAFTRTLRELIRGWQMLGYIHEHHFIVGRRPSDAWKKKWKWVGPFAPPLDFKYFICWWNGAVAQIISQDRPGSSNGISIDWIAGDEAKLLNEERYKTELSPANRGIIPEFSNNPYHHGVTFTSDMPVGSAGRWLLDQEKNMDKAVITEIWQLQKAKYELKHVIYPNATAQAQKEIEKQVVVINEELNDLRKGLFYYHEASTLDNVHAVGEAYIRHQLLTTSQFQFDTQILNIRPLKMENGFYPDFDEEIHGYFAEDSSYFDNTQIDYLNPVFDCRKDKDVDPNMPLHISLDYNRRMYPLEVAQVYKDEIRIVNSLQVLYPKKVKDVCKLFTSYYKPHQRKYVLFWFDPTATSEQRETTLSQDVIDALRSEKWIVQPMYIRQASFKSRYEMWGSVLTEDGKYSKRFRINRENCAKPILSIQKAGAKQGKEGYEKDKRTEADEKFPADESTHHSEALDTLVDGILNSGLSYSTENKSAPGIITN